MGKKLFIGLRMTQKTDDYRSSGSSYFKATLNWLLFSASELAQRTGNSLGWLYLARCILTVICYILSCWALEAMQSQSLRKQPGAAVMQTAQYTLALSRHLWLKRFLFFNLFPVFIVWPWFTANDENVKEFTFSTCLYVPIFLHGCF